MSKRKRSPRKGKHFEAATQRVFKKLRPNHQVLKNVEVKGILTGGSREIDVQVLEENGIDFLAIECKDEKQPVGTPIVEGWYGKLLELGAKEAAIVSNSGFARPARRYASKVGINLYNLVDTNDENVKFHLVFKMFAKQFMVVDLLVQYPTDSGLKHGTNLREMLDYQVELSGQEPTKLYAVAASLWNEDKVEVDEANRTAEVTLKNVTLRRNGEDIRLSWIKLNYVLIIKYFSGKQDVYDTQGVYDVINGSYETQSMAIGNWSPSDFGTDKFPEITSEQFAAEEFSIGVTLRAPMRDEPLWDD